MTKIAHRLCKPFVPAYSVGNAVEPIRMGTFTYLQMDFIEMPAVNKYTSGLVIVDVYKRVEPYPWGRSYDIIVPNVKTKCLFADLGSDGDRVVTRDPTLEVN